MRFNGNQNQGERQVPLGGDVILPLEVSLRDLYLGKFVEVRYRR